MKVGFIGLGMMGAGIASNIQKGGQELVVHDLTRQAAHRLSRYQESRSSRSAVETP